MLLLFTAAVAENAQIPIFIDGVRVAFFDADGSLLTPKEENGLLYVPLQAFCENMGLNAEVQGQSVVVDGMRIGLFDEAGNFLTPVQMDGMDYVPLAPFCNALGIQIEEENGGFAITRKTAEQRVAETKAQTGKIALTSDNFRTYFSYSLQATNVSMTPMRISSDGIYQGSYEADYVLTCEARSVFEIENVSFQLVGKPQGLDIEDIVILADMPASGSLTKTVHESGTLMSSNPKKEWASVDYTVVNHVSGCLIVDKEKADAANLASFQLGETWLQAEGYGEAEKIFSALSQIDYPNAKEKYDEAHAARLEAEAKTEETYQKAVALEEAEDYEQAISIYEEMGDYKDCAERITACNEKNEKKPKYWEAVKKEEDGDYPGAFQIYEEIGDYKDSFARGSFCIKKYQALNRVQSIEVKATSNTSRDEYELVYAYDGNGNPQSVEKKATLFYKETYTLDSEGFILAGKYEGKWSSREGCTVVSDIVYNEQENEIFCKSTYHSPDNRVYKEGSVYNKSREYTYNEYGNMLKQRVADGNSEWEYAYEYEYDEYGRINKCTTNGKDWQEYSYSSDGLLQQIKYFNNSGKGIRTDTYTYAYYGTERVHTEKGLAEHRERMSQLIEEAKKEPVVQVVDEAENEAQTEEEIPKEPEKTYTTLKPGNDSQEVLDARMKLYELGYFKKKPTQTKYTDSMADYVKKFEKDHGLTQDGVLSPEDQEVLFGE